MDNIQAILNLVTYWLYLDFYFFGFHLRYIDVVFCCFTFFVVSRLLGGGKSE